MTNPGGMTDSHRLFLQSFMSKGLLGKDEVLTLHRNANEKFPGSGEDLAEFVNTINMNIQPVHLEIKKGFHESNGTSCYVLVTTTSSDITRFASDLTSVEIEYLEKLVAGIAESDTGLLGSTRALNLTQGLRMTQEDAQNFITRMEDDNWLTITTMGEVGLSIRMILELDSYLRTTFEDYPIKCKACHRVCILGQMCARCDYKLHVYCAARMFKNLDEQVCPEKRCKAPWTHNVPGRDPVAEDKASSQKDSEGSHHHHRKRRRNTQPE